MEPVTVALGTTALAMGLLSGALVHPRSPLGHPRALLDDERSIGLTFDDGPSPRWTPRVLDALASRGARATFFVLARAAAAHPDLVRDTVRRGHHVELHGLSHRPFALSLPWRVRPDLDAARAIVEPLAGSALTCVRPPFGVRPLSQRALARAGLRLVTWSWSCGDWDGWGQKRTASIPMPRGRSICLFHDGDTASDSAREQTLRALDAVLAHASREELTPRLVSA